MAGPPKRAPLRSASPPEPISWRLRWLHIRQTQLERDLQQWESSLQEPPRVALLDDQVCCSRCQHRPDIRPHTCCVSPHEKRVRFPTVVPSVSFSPETQSPRRRVRRPERQYEGAESATNETDERDLDETGANAGDGEELELRDMDDFFPDAD
jgi:hypothetical protein